MEGKRDRELDYGLVSFEQQKVTEYSEIYFTSRPHEVQDEIIRKINSISASGLGSRKVLAAMRKRFPKPKQYDYSSEEDRIALGDGIIDIFHDQK